MAVPRIVQFSDLNLMGVLGAGAFGVVYKATLKGKTVAVKQLKVDMDASSTEAIEEFRAESLLMMQLKPHENVVTCIGMVPEPLCLIVAFLGKGSLESFCRKSPLQPKMMISIAKGTACGMAHIHEQGIVHRDLSARNILLDDKLTPKVSDFGLSRQINKNRDVNYAKGTKTDTG